MSMTTYTHYLQEIHNASLASWIKNLTSTDV